MKQSSWVESGSSGDWPTGDKDRQIGGSLGMTRGNVAKARVSYYRDLVGRRGAI